MHGVVEPRPVRRRDPQRHADQGRDQGREQHQRQGLQHGVPIALVHDQQQAEGHEDRQRYRALQAVGEGGYGQDQDQRRDVLHKAGQAVDRAVNAAGNSVEHAGAVGLDGLDKVRHHWADRDLVPSDPAAEAALSGWRPSAQSLQGRPAVICGHARQPLAQHLRVFAQPGPGRSLGILMLVQDLAHQGVFFGQGELQVLQEPPDIGALARIAGPGVGEHLGPAIVGAEGAVAAGEIAHVEALVHRVRLPAQEHDRLLVAHRPLDLGQHALLAGLDQLERAQASDVVADQVQHVVIAVIAGLDAIDRTVQLRREPLDVGKVVQAGGVGVGGDGQGVFGALQVGAHHIDRAVLDEGRAVGLLRGHPVAHEDVDVLVLHRRIGDRHRQDDDLGLVAEVFQDRTGQAGGGGHVGPADVGQAHRPALRMGRIRGEGDIGRRQQEADRQDDSMQERRSLHEASSPILLNEDSTP